MIAGFEAIAQKVVDGPESGVVLEKSPYDVQKFKTRDTDVWGSDLPRRCLQVALGSIYPRDAQT